MSKKALAVVTVLENPLNWESRYKNYHQFRRMCRDNGLVKLYTAEVVYKDQRGIRRPNVLTSDIDVDRNDIAFQFKTDSQIWHKENAINLLIQHVEEDYIAWVDADVAFNNPAWVQDTLEQLQNYKVVQMFSHAQTLGYSYQPIGCVRPGYIYQYKTEGEIYGGINFWGKSKVKIPPEKNAHPGYAWAASKDTISKLGGLIDWCIIGSGDFHMVAAFLGQLTKAIGNDYTEGYRTKCVTWENRADTVVDGSIGYVPGLVCHHWHGEINKRKYDTYQNILKECQFNPDFELIRDWQGLYMLHPESVTLRDKIQEYLRSRNDDSQGEVLIP